MHLPKALSHKAKFCVYYQAIFVRLARKHSLYTYSFPPSRQGRGFVRTCCIVTVQLNLHGFAPRRFELRTHDICYGMWGLFNIHGETTRHARARLLDFFHSSSSSHHVHCTFRRPGRTPLDTPPRLRPLVRSGKHPVRYFRVQPSPLLSRISVQVLALFPDPARYCHRDLSTAADLV